ncbi:capsular polysaccharide ABC transporter transmembrane protein [Gluconacetobacter liquefaciens NRIC 0522]|uniref:ABC transporter permease n=1 Tax=Gluconacetobacter liquefaciens TaxID=89584 RepID=A0A370G4Y1_GLULI|nr:ABC transporter permease [Gluconacetobacter liquefaciens]MBB2186354.1 ABC transporter permease [Gluconacetobacter liquefaciens]RDI38897.1 capsular polysaccharide transport system permease protein [Gluconacetobacter liquefaciens]GBR05125.1 capsular polysaccharide ABC transporter transmembrane protein [Gluconacetobacter liquefaciens NRIC 0522]
MKRQLRSSNRLLSHFRLQYKVIHALILREIHTRYGRDNLGFLWVIGEPILFCAGVAIVWTAIRPAREHGLAMTALVVTGYVPLTMWRHCLGRAVKAYESNGSLLFHRQVTPFDIITARTFLEIIGTIMAGMLVLGVAIILGYMKPPQSYGLIVLGLLYQSIFCFATALLAASLSEISDLVEKVVSIISYLSLPFSGAFIMVAWLPLRYQWILLLSPMANNIEMIRGGQFGIEASVRYDLFYNTWMTVLLLLIGIILTAGVRKHLEITG